MRPPASGAVTCLLGIAIRELEVYITVGQLMHVTSNSCTWAQKDDACLKHAQAAVAACTPANQSRRAFQVHYIDRKYAQIARYTFTLPQLPVEGFAIVWHSSKIGGQLEHFAQIPHYSHIAVNHKDAIKLCQLPSSNLYPVKGISASCNTTHHATVAACYPARRLCTATIAHCLLYHSNDTPSIVHVILKLDVLHKQEVGHLAHLV